MKVSSPLGNVLDSVASGMFSPDEPDRFRVLVDELLNYDQFMVAADFDAYWNAQCAVDALWNQPDLWWRASITNTARMGWFSSDRTVREYADEIWGLSV